MKLLFILYLALGGISQGAETAKVCTCTCVAKNADDTLSTITGKGKDREAAGENLKKSLGKKKCELSPTCSGKCTLDSD